jgi:hypothetical protein
MSSRTDIKLTGTKLIRVKMIFTEPVSPFRDPRFASKSVKKKIYMA